MLIISISHVFTYSQKAQAHSRHISALFISSDAAGEIVHVLAKSQVWKQTFSPTSRIDFQNRELISNNSWLSANDVDGGNL